MPFWTFTSSNVFRMRNIDDNFPPVWMPTNIIFNWWYCSVRTTMPIMQYVGDLKWKRDRSVNLKKMFFQFFHVLLSKNRKIKVQKEGALSKSRLTLSWAGTTDFIMELRVSKSKRNSKVPFPLWILYVFHNWYGRANLVVYLYEQNSSQWSSNAGECYLWKTL